MKKIYLYQPAGGCIESYLDFKKAALVLENNGWMITNRLKNADMILVNSCAVAGFTHTSCLRGIEKLGNKMKKRAQIVLTGCLPDYDLDVLSKYGISFSFGARKLDSFLEHFKLKDREEQMGFLEPEYLGVYNLFNWASRLIKLANRFYVPVPAYLCRRLSLFEDKDVVYLRINRGCKESCAYCATKFATGQLVSMPLEKILAQFDKYLKEGHRIFALCGEETGSYGQDIGKNLPMLLKELLKRKEQFIINIRQHSPGWLIQNLDSYLEVLSDKRVKYINLPFQSGSNRILELMGRRYNAEELFNVIKTIHQNAPHLMLRTHVIVGFPTETEEDFKRTVAFIDELPWDMVLIFPYEDRPRTQSYAMKNKVPRLVAIRRTAFLTLKVFWKLYLNNG